MKPENIILMMYSSNLNDMLNPYPGKIFTNEADSTDGDWAQYGCFEHIDYTSQSINPDVFLAILSGDKDTVRKLTNIENPKVLNGGPNDTVFTYFIDHGDFSQIYIGSSLVTETRFFEALQKAHDRNLYGKWVWFMEACYGGSMFDRVTSGLNIYAMTSADAHHIAKMSECPPNDRVGSKHFYTCLGGLWDNIWLDYFASHPSSTIGEIVDASIAQVADLSDQTVSQFGALAFRDLPLSDFIGELPASLQLASPTRSPRGLVDITEVPLHLAKWTAIRADSTASTDALAAYQRLRVLAARREVEAMRLGVALLGERAAAQAWERKATAFDAECVRRLAEGLETRCGDGGQAGAAGRTEVSNLLKNVCAPGVSVPEVDWEDVCM